MNILHTFKVLIVSRRLFSNCLSAEIRYYLVKYGTLKGGIKVKCGSKEHVLSPRIYLNIVKWPKSAPCFHFSILVSSSQIVNFI